MLRTHTCGELSKANTGQKVVLCGWVDQMRIFGKIGFLRIRDRYGSTQVFLNPELAAKYGYLRKESVVKVEGLVKERPEKDQRKEPSGDIELKADLIEILQDIPPLPLEIDIKTTTEETRLKYRYLDLRTDFMTKNIILRHKIVKAIRDFLDKEGFLEVETPILGKSTPEGARDYLVPSRIYKGKFYALPQSPQIFKQLLMVGGIDKYFQIARCMRDEDLRADRQPEFTQLDLEISFAQEEDIYSVFERLMRFVWKQVLDVDVSVPFERITYKESIKKYDSDKPDMRKKNENFKFVWVTEFPLFEYSQEEKRYVSCHHPFTGINPDDVGKLGKSYDLRSRSYDLVLNGWELGSGSVRIHDSSLQSKVFKTLNISDSEAKQRFGFFVDALKFAPPHAGFAIGIDRLVALAAGVDSIRDVIAFPKNKDAKDLMMDSPSAVKKKQLDELNIVVKK